MAGMATTAPTGTASSAAPRRATGHGRWASTRRWLKVAAPTATKAAWHSDTCPAVFTSRPSDRKITT